jgi:hypothetical protein
VTLHYVMERAEDCDYWLYQVLQKGLIRSSAPRINAAKLAGLFLPVDDKPWSAEVSGRALSIARDIREFAERRAAQNPSLKFRHLVDIAVPPVRAVQGCDVWLTPTEDDPAHADLTYAGEKVKDDTGTYTIPHEMLISVAEALGKAMGISDPAVPGGPDRIEARRQEST